MSICSLMCSRRYASNALLSLQCKLLMTILEAIFRSVTGSGTTVGDQFLRALVLCHVLVRSGTRGLYRSVAQGVCLCIRRKAPGSQRSPHSLPIRGGAAIIRLMTGCSLTYKHFENLRVRTRQIVEHGIVLGITKASSRAAIIRLTPYGPPGSSEPFSSFSF